MLIGPFFELLKSPSRLLLGRLWLPREFSPEPAFDYPRGSAPFENC